MSGKTIRAVEVRDHGWDHAQYFQGHSAMFTEFDASYLGAGQNAKEAYEDAIDNMAQMGEYDVESKKLPSRPRGIRKTDKVECECGEDDECEHYYYVSIRVR
jgi:hypothetical protein